ncbi:MAG TPA: class F sortase, partial [Candidatus Dormibacteraeota bacterium]
ASGAFVPAQLVIERLRVRAPVEVKGIDAHNIMEAPDRGTEAAWYRFTPRPGAGSNAVFAGHRDFGQVGNPAIFWHLDQLVAGDVVDVVSSQQTEIRYRVTQTWDYGLRDIPMQKVLATDPVEEVTLITCSGAYARGVGYDHRLVVRAVRMV